MSGIIKPKTGISPNILLKMVQQLVECGVNFIKEDEILSNPQFCSIEDRIPLIMNYLNQRVKDGYPPVIYAVCINSDAPYLLKRVQQVYDLGGNAIHINFWSGLGSYLSVRKLTENLTNSKHDYHIDWKVICYLAGISGVDFIHTGI